MQLTPIYLYKQIIPVQISDEFHTTRNKIVYAADLVLHKGVDNELYFQFKNADQKRTPIGNKELTLVVIDDRNFHHQVLFEVPLQIMDANKGVAKCIVPEHYLFDIEEGRYFYSVKALEPTGIKQQSYVDDNYGSRGVVRVELGPDPKLVDSQILTFDPITNLTDVVGNISSLQSQNTIHTAIVKFDSAGFTGSIIAQATLDTITDQFTPANFIDIASVNLTNQTTPIVMTFTGNYTGVRFLQGVTSGSIVEIHYRH